MNGLNLGVYNKSIFDCYAEARKFNLFDKKQAEEFDEEKLECGEDELYDLHRYLGQKKCTLNFDSPTTIMGLTMALYGYGRDVCFMDGDIYGLDLSHPARFTVKGFSKDTYNKYREEWFKGSSKKFLQEQEDFRLFALELASKLDTCYRKLSQKDYLRIINSIILSEMTEYDEDKDLENNEDEAEDGIFVPNNIDTRSESNSARLAEASSHPAAVAFVNWFITNICNRELSELS